MAKQGTNAAAAANTGLYLWGRVERTDPDYTKDFSRGGGFKGTAIDTLYNVKRATEMWGPIGGRWGYTILDQGMDQGAVIDDKGNREVIHWVMMSLYFPDAEGNRCESSPQFGATTFVGKNKYGPYTDEEARKKSVTDALSKCLSQLGFSADVFLGLFDANKYVAENKAAAAASKAAAKEQAFSASDKAKLDELLAEIESATNETFDDIYTRAKEFAVKCPVEHRNSIAMACNSRRAELVHQANNAA